jgi:hypothetical protein
MNDLPEIDLDDPLWNSPSPGDEAAWLEYLAESRPDPEEGPPELWDHSLPF